MVSTLSGPIPSHPMYDRSVRVPNPVPRVRPEAQSIARMHQGSVSLISQLDGAGPISYRTKSQPKDYTKENVRKMRQIQRQSRQKEEQKVQPVKALWKSEKYKDVKSKITEDIVKEPLTPRPGSANFLRSHSRTGYNRPSSPVRPRSTEPPAEKLSVPKAEISKEVQLIRHDVDFIKVNGKLAKQNQIKKAPSENALDELKKKKEADLHHYEKGHVPNYLTKRQKQWEKDEVTRKANVPDPNMPPGHRCMPEMERRETLTKLKETEKELLQQMSALPVRTDTLRVRTQKQQVEAKLTEVEEAIKIFSRAKVYVKLDEQ